MLHSLCCLCGSGVVGGPQRKSRAVRASIHDKSQEQGGNGASRAYNSQWNEFSSGFLWDTSWKNGLSPEGTELLTLVWPSSSSQEWPRPGVANGLCEVPLISPSVLSHTARCWAAVGEGLGKTLCIILGCCQRQSAPAALLWTQITRVQALRMHASCWPAVAPVCHSSCSGSRHQLFTFHCRPYPSPHCTLQKLILWWNLFSKF